MSRKSTGEIVKPVWRQFSFLSAGYDVLHAIEYFRMAGDTADGGLEKLLIYFGPSSNGTAIGY
ncbi:MAG: hypothetical protein ABI477_24095 [Chryseolinea sp.]